ncbi:hypothetical protein GN956_G15137 [Arapaima gigas]
MEETYLLNYPGVKKKILHGGVGPKPHFPPGTKLVFHLQTLKDNFDRKVIDDSRKFEQPLEIFVGKMFKMEVWEVLLTSMRIGEVAEFWCDAVHTGLYPVVSKGLRLIAEGKDPLEGQKHTCGMSNMFHYTCTGHPDLEELMKEPQPLIFIMELIAVGDPFSYKRESWMMEKDEKLQAVPALHLQGNALVKQGRFQEAAQKYQEAVVLLRTVQSREMPGDEDYIGLDRLITPLVLNYCQCMLELEEYYEVLEHTTELLEKHKDNVKAYYKRAKAHVAVWNEKEAREDYLAVANLDTTLAPLVRRELRQLSERMRDKYWEEKSSYWGILEEKDGEKNPEKEKVEEKEEEGRGKKGTLPPYRGEREDKEEELIREDGKPDEGTKSGQRSDEGASSVTEGKDWQQMLRLIPVLQGEGNVLIKEQRYLEAAEKYREAIEYIRFLQDKPELRSQEEDWESLEKVRLPLSLNLSQCMLELGEYSQVVLTNSELLKKHKGNIKAVYQRARAHSALCNEEEARRDFGRVARLDSKFKPIVRLELKKMGENIRAKHTGDKKNYWTVTEEKWGHSRKGVKKGKRKEPDLQVKGGGGGNKGEVKIETPAKEQGSTGGQGATAERKAEGSPQNSAGKEDDGNADPTWDSGADGNAAGGVDTEAPLASRSAEGSAGDVTPREGRSREAGGAAGGDPGRAGAKITASSSSVRSSGDKTVPAAPPEKNKNANRAERRGCRRETDTAAEQ